MGVQNGILMGEILLFGYDVSMNFCYELDMGVDDKMTSIKWCYLWIECSKKVLILLMF